MGKEYGPLGLPSGKKIKFRAPVGLDRVAVLQNMPSVGQGKFMANSILADEYIRAKCVTEVDGAPFDGKYKALFDNWDALDIDFYGAVFNELFGMTEDRQKKMKEAVDFLSGAQTSTAG